MVADTRLAGDAGENAIAIIGMAGRFPGSDTVEDFWQNLVDGRETTTRFSREELMAAGLPAWVIDDPEYVPVRGIIRAVEDFDAAFFGYSPREAELLDPQQRVFLEVAYGALEQAGYDPFNCPGSVGVFAGENQNSYLLFNIIQSDEVLSGVHGLVINTDKDFLATRVSYKLDLKGPAITVQSACSTSLVCVHMACQSLIDGECDMAIAGGVSIVFPHAGYFHQKGGVMAPDGHCRPFDRDAQGTFGSDGAGAVLLKRLADARRDGDHVRAVILGSAINNDGSDKASFAAPSVKGQSAVIVEAMGVAGISPADIGYIETHGTGTPLGDPVEVTALMRAYRAMGMLPRDCVLGSLKSNFGHLDQAAGIANLIKAALVVERGTLPPTLHFSSPNPELGLESTPFRISAACESWPTDAACRVAGVSSFGFGGTNAHVIVAQPDHDAERQPDRPMSGRRYTLLPVAARSREALDESLTQLAAHLRRFPDTALACTAHTLAHGRPRFQHRAVVVAESTEQAASIIEKRQDTHLPISRVLTGEPAVIFMFPGQGNQYPGMGRALYEQEPVFREVVDRAATVLQPELGLDLRDLLYPAAGTEAQASVQLRETRFSQPALFVTEVAAAKLWIDQGIEPDAMIGHSIGEWSAAYLAGVFDFEDALRLVALRARLMQAQPPGDMIAVTTGAERLRDIPVADVEIAADNSPNLCVLTGTPEGIAAATEWVRSQGHAVQQLHTSHAFHSAMMEGALAPLEAAIAGVKRNPPSKPVISNLSGTWMTAEQACSPGYWSSQLRHTVMFRSGVTTLLEGQDAILLELGPGRTLATFARQSESHAAGHAVVATMCHAQDSTRFGDDLLFSQALGRVWTMGLLPATLPWNPGSDQSVRKVALPGYPFERRRYFIEPRRLGSEISSSQARQHRQPVERWLHSRVWQRSAIPPAPSDPSAFGQSSILTVGFPAALQEALQDAIASLGEAAPSCAPVDFGTDRHDAAERRAVLAAQLRESRHASATGVHVVCWLDAFLPSRGQNGAPDLARAAQTALLALLDVVAACTDTPAEPPLWLTILSTDSVDLSASGRASLSAAAATGALRALAGECPGIHISHVDVSSSSPPVLLASQLLIELRAITPADTDKAESPGNSGGSVVWRARHRHCETWQQQPCPPLDNRAAGTLLKDRLVLITGGTGEIGLTLATHFGREHGARLLLVARNALPAVEQWTRLIDDPDTDEAMRRTLRTLSRLREDGVTMMIRQVDIADGEALSAVVAEAVSLYGPLHGVAHAAGISGAQAFSRLSDIDAAILDQHWRAKVHGCLSIKRIVEENEDVAFCLMQSSTFGALGVPGTVAYCAASAWMEQFVESMQDSPAAWLSLGWDAWLPPGMDAGAMAENAVHADEALRLIDGLLKAAMGGRYLVSARDLQLRVAVAAASTATAGNKPDSTRQYDRPELDTDYLAPENRLEQAQVDIWSELLGLRQVGVLDDFFALGGHSLLATQLVARIQEQYPVDFQLHDLIDNPTPRSVATLLETRILEMIEEMSDEQAEQMAGMLTA